MEVISVPVCCRKRRHTNEDPKLHDWCRDGPQAKHALKYDYSKKCHGLKESGHRPVQNVMATALRGSRMRRRCHSAKHVERKTGQAQRVAELSKPTRVEARLFAILRRLEPGIRRSTLARCFSESQRLALEQWILMQRRKSGRHHEARKEKIYLANRRGCHSLDGRHAEGLRTKVARQRGLPKSGMHGIHARTVNDYRTYCASTQVGPFAVTTPYFTDIEQARCRYEAISAMRARLAGCPACSVENYFRAALRAETQNHGFQNAAEMGLRFSVVIPAKYWVGTSLKSPQFMASTECLEEGLCAWRRLSEARGLVYQGRTNRYTILRKHSPMELQQAWEKLRALYINIWVEAGFSRRRVTARLEVLEARHRDCRERLETLWQSGAGSAHRKALTRVRVPALSPPACSSASTMEGNSSSRSSDSNGVALQKASCVIPSRERKTTSSILVRKLEHRILRLLSQWSPSGGAELGSAHHPKHRAFMCLLESKQV